MNKILSITILSCCLLLISSCKKSATGCEISMTNISGTYKIIARTFQSTPSSTVVDDYTGLAACVNDNLYI